MIVVSDTTPLNYINYEKARDRLIKETSFYVTDDVLGESERRYHERKQAQEQDQKTRESSVPTPEDNEKKGQHGK